MGNYADFYGRILYIYLHWIPLSVVKYFRNGNFYILLLFVLIVTQAVNNNFGGGYMIWIFYDLQSIDDLHVNCIEFGILCCVEHQLNSFSYFIVVYRVPDVQNLSKIAI